MVAKGRGGGPVAAHSKGGGGPEAGPWGGGHRPEDTRDCRCVCIAKVGLQGAIQLQLTQQGQLLDLLGAQVGEVNPWGACWSAQACVSLHPQLQGKEPRVGTQQRDSILTAIPSGTSQHTYMGDC